MSKKVILLRLKAFILSLTLLVYITELAALPLYITPAPAPAKENCCARKKANVPCKKPTQDCNTTNCCVNCPLCYVMTISGFAMPAKLSGTVKKEYPHYLSNYVFKYYSTAWKPPNGC